MKTTSPSLFFSKRSLLLLSTVAVGLATPSLTRAADGTWTNTNGGTWNTPGNWSGNTVADGAGSIANFNSAVLPASVTVNLTSAQTVGRINFSNTNAAFGYTIDGSGILTLAGSAPGVAPIISVAGGNTAIINSVLSGTDGLTKLSATGQNGTLVLNGQNTYSGRTSLVGGNVGFVQLGSNAALGQSTVLIDSANGGIRYGSAFNDLRDIEFGTNGGRIDTGAFDVTYSSTLFGSIGAGGTFAKVGSGTLTLAGTNSLSAGTVNVGAGFLKIDSNARLGGSAVALTLNAGGIRYGASFNDLRSISLNGNGSGTLDTNGFNVTYSSTISSTTGSGAFIKTGQGTLRLTADNAYSRNTNVTAGTLLINGNQTLATGAVTVSSGATLGGVGIVGGATTIVAAAGSNPGGILSPGDGLGTLTFNSSLSLGGGSTYKFDGGDLVVVAGGLTLSDNWILSLGTGLANGGSVTLFTFGSLTSADLTPVFDLSQLGFTPTGPLTLTQNGNSIVLNGVQAIPEPSTYALLILGFGAMVWMHRLRRRSSVN